MARVAQFPFRIACCVLALARLAATQAPAAPSPETFVLEGRVVDLRGEGVPAAKVWIATSPPPAPPVVQVIADGEGYFRMKAPLLDWLQVQASGEGTCRGVAFARRSTLAVRIEVTDGVIVRGVLRTRDGKALQDVPVRAYADGRALGNSYSDGRTDAEGRFALTGVALGPTRIVAWVDGEGLAVIEQRIAGDCEVALAPLEMPTTDLRIELAGVPAAKVTAARVRLYPYANGGLRELPPPLDSPHLDTSGVLELKRMPDHEYRVDVFLDGFVIGPDHLTAKQKQGPHVLKFTGTPAVATDLEWKATVQRPDGAALAGITFVMRSSGGGREARATSDADGKLVFQCPLPEGSDGIVYSVDDRWVTDQKKEEQWMHGSSDRRFLAWHECKVTPSSTLQVRVVPACTVKGRLLKDGGQRAAFVRVELEERRANRGPEWMTMAWATTNRDGHFVFARLHHLDDAVRVMTNTPDGAATSEALAIATAGTQVTVPDLKLMPPASVDGVVLDSQQRPAPGVRVWLRDWDLNKGGQRSGSVTEVITDRQGRYRFVGVPPGGAWLQLLPDTTEDGERKVVEPFEVEAGKTYSFDLQLPAK